MFVCLLGPGKPGSYFTPIKKKKYLINTKPNTAVLMSLASFASVSFLSYLASFLASPNFIYILLINFFIRLIPLLSSLAKDLASLYRTV